MNAPDVLNLAADRIDDQGWWHKPDPRSGGGTCVVLAISAVATSELEGQEAADALAAYLGLPWTHSPISPLVKWNDTVGRTKLEVTVALRAAALVNEQAAAIIAGAQEQKVLVLA